MNGQTRLDGAIDARCLVRLLLDGENNPILFMERIYSNSDDSRYNDALAAIAKRKADNFQTPLLSLEGQGELYKSVYSHAGAFLGSIAMEAVTLLPKKTAFSQSAMLST